MKKNIVIAALLICSMLYSGYYLIGHWYLIEKSDPITDEKEISIFMNKQEENSLNFNTLMIKINKNFVNINLYTPSLIFKKRFDDNDRIDIIYRFDKNELRTLVLNKYGENEFYSLTNSHYSSQKSIILLKEMLYYDKLALRAIENIDNVKHTYTYVYDLIKLREILSNANFSDTILEDYQKELASIMLQKLEDETNIYESIKTNIYIIDDINYEKPII